MRFCRRFWYYAAQKVRPFFNIDMNGKKISGLADPTQDNEAARKKYVDEKIDGDMLKSTYDTEPNGIVDNSEKLEESSKAEVQDHFVKEHALSSHSDPSSDVNMGGRHITHIGQPTEDQDIATKKYADDLLGGVTPADIPLFGWGWVPSTSETTMRSQYATIKAIGMNAFLATFGKDSFFDLHWRTNMAVTTYFDLMYRVAEEMDIGIFLYIGTHRLSWENPEGEVVVDRYKGYSSCLGWMYADEPAARPPPNTWTYSGCKDAYDWLKARDPNHYIYASWTHDLFRNWQDQYWQVAHLNETDNWCKLGNVGSINLYPWHDAGSGMPKMDFWLPYQVHTHNAGESPAGDDAAGDCGKGVIPTMEATGVWGMLDQDGGTGIVDQYNKWKDAFADCGGIKGVCLFPASHFLFASGDDAENLRNQIKALARLLGWGG